MSRPYLHEARACREGLELPFGHRGGIVAIHWDKKDESFFQKSLCALHDNCKKCLLCEEVNFSSDNAVIMGSMLEPQLGEWYLFALAIGKYGESETRHYEKIANSMSSLLNNITSVNAILI